MIDEDDQNYGSDEEGYDAAPLLTKNYGSCANASRLRPVHHQKFHCVLAQIVALTSMPSTCRVRFTA